MPDQSEVKFKKARLVVAIATLLLVASLLAWKMLELDEDYPTAQRLVNAMIAKGEIEFLTIAACPDYVAFSGEESEEIGEKRWKIVDSAILTDRSSVDALLRGVLGTKPEIAAECIGPRHGVRMLDNPQNYLLICFQCSNFEYSYGSHGFGIFTPDELQVYKTKFETLVEDLAMTPPPQMCDDWGEPKRD